MPVAVYSSHFTCPVAELWAFHERPDAFQLLSPPFPPVRVVRDTGGLEAGSEKEILIFFSLIRWVARHVECVPGRSFTDVQLSGPFREWRHEHRMEPEGSGSRLVDHVTFEAIGGRLTEPIVRLMLCGLFAYRHQATRKHVER